MTAIFDAPKLAARSAGKCFGEIPWAGTRGGTNATKLKREIGRHATKLSREIGGAQRRKFLVKSLAARALGGTNATKLKREIGGMQRNCHVKLAARSAGNFW